MKKSFTYIVGNTICIFSFVSLVYIQPSLAGGYFKPSLVLKNDVSKTIPKCFYKYLTADIGYSWENWQGGLQINWLDHVDTVVAYRVAFPYVVNVAYDLSSVERVGVTGLALGSISPYISPNDLIEAEYSKEFAVSDQTSLYSSGMLRYYPSMGVCALTPGFKLVSRHGKVQYFVSYNDSDIKDTATLDSGMGIVSSGASIGLRGDSYLNISMNAALGNTNYTGRRIWMDIGFDFGSMFTTDDD